MINAPRFWFTTEEGGTWYPFDVPFDMDDEQIRAFAETLFLGHSIKTERGRIWDRTLGCFRDEYEAHKERHFFPML